jgi:hypothetical protein
MLRGLEHASDAEQAEIAVGIRHAEALDALHLRRRDGELRREVV